MAEINFSSVLVTGANRGIGLELVKQLLGRPKPPQWVFATCRDPKGAGAQGCLAPIKRGPVVLFPAESTDEGSIKAAAQVAEAHLAGKGLTLLINNAGIMPPSTLDSMTQEDMLSVYHVNVVGPMEVTKAFLPMLMAAAQQSTEKGLSSSRAAVINISSIGGSIGNPPSFRMFPVIAYRCSKAALNMLTRCQALEYKARGILCAAIHPGWVKTDLGTDKPKALRLEQVLACSKGQAIHRSLWEAGS
ncbi:hypothetical protein JRQ81_006464 [Phrynocephalus forsythii]|uniref:Uncharacterized protein n=1 Tax=Phrynocephalus forsythii TaxID=171643 RepID=A0A9Q0XEQ9_9SAUR|nr:hypothetical protein JRQ81_006464 [Phrynocephalus forsythii]